MASQHEQLTRLQTALAQLSAQPATAAVLYPGTERYSLITFLLQKLLNPELVNALQQRAADIDLPPGISVEEMQAHRLARMLQSVDFHATVDQVRGCTSPEESLHVLASLATLAAAHQQNLAEAAASASASAAAQGASTSGRAASPAPTPRHRTPTRTGGHFSGGAGGSQDGGGGGGGGGGGRLLGLHSLDAEMRTLEGLVDKLPQYLEPGGGTNWFPADIMVALQPYLQQQQQQSIPEVAASVEQRAQKLREGTPALRAEVAKLATEVTVANEAEWLQQAEATRLELAELLQTSAAFYQTFQTGLGVWCQASKAAETCGLGPMAAEFVQRYEALRSLGSDLARVRQAYNSIVSCAPPLTLLEQHTLSQLVRAGQAAVEQANARIAVVQRLLAEGEADAARAASVLRAVEMAQPAAA